MSVYLLSVIVHIPTCIWNYVLPLPSIFSSPSHSSFPLLLFTLSTSFLHSSSLLFHCFITLSSPLPHHVFYLTLSSTPLHSNFTISSPYNHTHITSHLDAKMAAVFSEISRSRTLQAPSLFLSIIPRLQTSDSKVQSRSPTTVRVSHIKHTHRDRGRRRGRNRDRDGRV